MLYAIVGALVIILDQWVKFWVADVVVYASEVRTFIPGILSIVNVHNDGAAFSILSGGDARIYFIILTVVFTLAVILALATRFISGRLARWSIVLVTAGGLSNCIDRVIYGYVQDMFKVELFNFAVFNVADIFITVFAILFAIAMIFEKDDPMDDEDSILFENDDEDDDRPSRRRKAEKAAAAEAREFAPVVKRPKFDPQAFEKEEKRSRKERRAKYEDEYEEFKSSRAARQQDNPASAAAAAAAARQKAPANKKTADPFAEWEKANAKVSADKVSKPVAKPVRVNDDFEQPAAEVVESPVVKKPVEVKEAPVVKETKPASSVEEFSLDDILNEFK